ncbi:hypothetical protein [Amycolatopsis pretoriensis]|uniref:hypothetical protein n=1 Tax=Amycolatopsis pretoriensis TaxID=218821 RepID=UPI001FC955CA|nr:hypothetical protein [Amycolatopsis pretoriensis]
MDLNAESGDLEQLVQQLSRCLCQVQCEVGKSFQPTEVCRSLLSGQVGSIQLFDDGQRSGFPAFEVVVTLAQPAGERIVGIAFARLLQDGVLLARERGQELLLAGSLGRTFPRRGSIDAAQLGFQNRSPLRSEEPVGVEPADGFEEFVLAHSHRSRQSWVEVRCGQVVLPRPTEVIGRAPRFGVARHASPAAVDHAPAEEVLPFGERMAVVRVAVA